MISTIKVSGLEPGCYVGYQGWPLTASGVREIGRWRQLIRSEGATAQVILAAEDWSDAKRNEAQLIYPDAMLLEEKFIPEVSHQPFALVVSDVGDATIALGPAVESVWEPFRLLIPGVSSES